MGLYVCHGPTKGCFEQQTTEGEHNGEENEEG
jgi:hypothetical protein